MIDLDRRTLFGVAGASLVVAGASLALPEAAQAGVDAHFGIDPASARPLSSAYNPKAICVMMIGLGSKISHSVAHYEFASGVGAARGEGIAGEIIRHHLAVGAFPNAMSSGVMSQSPGDLSDMVFRAPHRIYIYLSGSNIEFGGINNNALRFTRYNHQEQPMSANTSFFEAKLISIAGLPKKIQSLSNLHLGGDGQPLTRLSPSRTYSMNIAAMLQSSVGRAMPLVIDPDIKNDGPPH